jgi:hypothetical protein
MSGTVLCVLVTCVVLVFGACVAWARGPHAPAPPQQQHPPVPVLSDVACASLARSWVAHAKAVDARRGSAPHVNLTFFLHVPRTAGRTLFFCALKPAFAPSERCPRSYDTLRVRDLAHPSCRLLSSHDDFRVVDALPGNATVVMQLRRPLTRLLSAYEFAVEVASRSAFGRVGPGRSRLAGARAPTDATATTETKTTEAAKTETKTEPAKAERPAWDKFDKHLVDSDGYYVDEDLGDDVYAVLRDHQIALEELVRLRLGYGLSRDHVRAGMPVANGPRRALFHRVVFRARVRVGG